jgi:acyl-CoA oxidase
MLGTLVGGRICVAKGALSGAKLALHIAVKYALNRRQFNDASRVQEDLIMDYPTHQLRLAPPIAKAYVYQAALDRLIVEYSNADDTDRRKLETQVAGLKAEVTWFANRTIQECREACGGKGYLLENRIAGLKNDVDIFTTFEGDNTVLLQLAAKGVLSDFREEFNSDDFGSVLKLLGAQLGSRLSAINPLYTNKVDKEHLFNPKFHLHAFHYRTQRLTYTLAMRLRDYSRKGISTHQAFLKVQTHLLALGKAYSNELAYQYFLDFTKAIENEKYNLLMGKLGTLFSLYEILQDSAWYQEHGYLGSNKSKAIRNRVERLSTELRPHIDALVNGFGVPGKLVNAPIAET